MIVFRCLPRKQEPTPLRIPGPTAQVDDQNVASKTDIAASDLPVTVNTVSLDMIQQQDLTDIVPAINNLPAANAWTQYRGDCAGQRIYLPRATD
jgi:hypothetical protein